MVTLLVSLVAVALVVPAQPAADGDRRLGGHAPQVVFQRDIGDELIQEASRLNVYRLEPPGLDMRSFSTLGQRLFRGRVGGDPVRLDTVVAVSGDQRPSDFMMLDTHSGLFSFSRGFADQIDDRAGELPTPERAADIARQLLAENGLAPRRSEEMVLAHVGRVRSQSYDPTTGTEGQILDQMLTVYFARVVDGTMVVGSASKMIVHVGDGGQVFGGIVRWRELGAQTRPRARDLRSAQRVGPETVPAQALRMLENASADATPPGEEPE